MAEKKKKAISPQAAKILEQYRNAGKPATGNNGASGPDVNPDAPARPTPAPPSAAQQRRSGTRGK